MNESADPLVDVPAASPDSEPLSQVRFDASAHQLTISLRADATRELDDLLDDLSEVLAPDAGHALSVEVCGPGARAGLVRSLVDFITVDCDRTIHTLQLQPDARDALLREAVGRSVGCLSPTRAEPRTTPPPIRPFLSIAPPVKPIAPDAQPGPLPRADTLGNTGVPGAPEHGADTPPDSGDAALTHLPPSCPPSEDAPCVDSLEACISEASVADALPPEQALDSAPPTVPVDASEATPDPTALAACVEPSTERVNPPATDDASHSRPWGSMEDGDRRVLVLRRTVRSGKSVRFAGDVVIFGDVNHGAQVVADGDVVVLGRLRGLAHAGWRGDNTSVVVGLDMQSGQVRIGNTIAFPCPAEPNAGTSRIAALLRRVPSTPTRSVTPSVARVVDGAIRIEDYHGRLHS